MSFWLGACRGEKLACDLPLFPPLMIHLPWADSKQEGEDFVL